MRHPLHPAIVHFPVATWSLAVATDYASLIFGQSAWQWSAGLLAVGCLTALAAMLTGMLELARIPEGPALKATWLHMAAMLTAFSLFLASLILRLEELQPQAPTLSVLIIDGLGFIALAFGGYMGGRLVYGHGVGR